MTVTEQVMANKVKIGPEEALAIVRECGQVWVSRGKKVLHFDMKKDAPADEELLKVVMGRSGNLRAPTLRLGKRLIVGFHQETFTDVFG